MSSSRIQMLANNHCRAPKIVLSNSPLVTTWPDQPVISIARIGKITVAQFKPLVRMVILTDPHQPILSSPPNCLCLTMLSTRIQHHRKAAVAQGNLTLRYPYLRLKLRSQILRSPLQNRAMMARSNIAVVAVA